MFRANSLILYVDDVDRSTAFYRDILKADPVETYQDFSVFALNDDFVVGLQSKHAIDPKPQRSFGGFELSCAVQPVTAEFAIVLPPGVN